MGIVLPKYNQRKGRPMSRSKNYLVQQLQARPIQPKTIISGQNGVFKRLLPPQGSIEILQTNGVPSKTISTTQTTLLTHASPLPTTSATLISVVPPFVELVSCPTVICNATVDHDSIPQISIPSPAAYETENDEHNVDHMEEPEDEEEPPSPSGGRLMIRSAFLFLTKILDPTWSLSRGTLPPLLLISKSTISSILFSKIRAVHFSKRQGDLLRHPHLQVEWVITLGCLSFHSLLSWVLYRLRQTQG